MSETLYRTRLEGWLTAAYIRYEAQISSSQPRIEPHVAAGPWLSSNGEACDGPDMASSFVVTGDTADWRPYTVPGATDEAGWRYGIVFPDAAALGAADGYSAESKTSAVRWRRWQRTRHDAETTPQAIQPSSSSSSSELHNGERWENERWWVGVGWTGTSPITSFAEDPHHWTDASSGESCKSCDPATWTVILLGSVDADGWEYATSFESFNQRPAREGGRAANRVTDAVRRRKWVEFGSPVLAEARAQNRLAVTRVEEVDGSLLAFHLRKLLETGQVQ